MISRFLIRRLVASIGAVVSAIGAGAAIAATARRSGPVPAREPAIHPAPAAPAPQGST